MEGTEWDLKVPTKIGKSILGFPESVRERLFKLFKELQLSGPIRANWPNYSKLGSVSHHCHVKKGKPTYVACWTVIGKNKKIIEVYYVGTHENAPY